MIDSIKVVKVKTINEWFSSSIPADAVDLICKMLDFNPSRRPTAVQILQHPYLSQFHNPSEETISPSIIRPPISDNKKLSLKEYRNLLYEQIKRVYNRESTTTTAASGQILSPAPGAANRNSSELGSPKRKIDTSDKELHPPDLQRTKESSHHKSSHSILSSSKSKDPKYIQPARSGDYQAQIRSLLEEEASRLQKKASGYLPRRK